MGHAAISPAARDSIFSSRSIRNRPDQEPGQESNPKWLYPCRQQAEYDYEKHGAHTSIGGPGLCLINVFKDGDDTARASRVIHLFQSQRRRETPHLEIAGFFAARARASRCRKIVTA